MMHAEDANTPQKSVPDGRQSPNRRAVLLVCLTVVVSLVAIVLVRPRVREWLTARAAYRELSSQDNDARTDAARRLRRMGENIEGELIELLHHSDAGVRRFAATELAYRAPLSDEVIQAFLSALETNRHVEEICQAAANLFFRHAERATGPLTETDQRMIAWLSSELNSTIPERSGPAAWALTAFVRRDPSLREPLAIWLETGTFFYSYIVLREMAEQDPSLREAYIDLLLGGLLSQERMDNENARYGLTQLTDQLDDVILRMESIRNESNDPSVIARINETLFEIRRDRDIRQ